MIYKVEESCSAPWQPRDPKHVSKGCIQLETMGFMRAVMHSGEQEPHSAAEPVQADS